MRSIVSHTVVAARSCIADQPTGIRQTSTRDGIEGRWNS